MIEFQADDELIADIWECAATQEGDALDRLHKYAGVHDGYAHVAQRDLAQAQRVLDFIAELLPEKYQRRTS